MAVLTITGGESERSSFRWESRYVHVYVLSNYLRNYIRERARSVDSSLPGDDEGQSLLRQANRVLTTEQYQGLKRCYSQNIAELTGHL